MIVGISLTATFIIVTTMFAVSGVPLIALLIFAILALISFGLFLLGLYKLMFHKSGVPEIQEFDALSQLEAKEKTESRETEKSELSTGKHRDS